METAHIITTDSPAISLAAAWLTIADAAAYAKLSKDVLYAACERGELRHVRIGGRRSIRLRRDWIDDWLLRHARGATVPTAPGAASGPLRDLTEARSQSDRSPSATSTGPASVAQQPRDPQAATSHDRTQPSVEGTQPQSAHAETQPARTGPERARQLRQRGRG